MSRAMPHSEKTESRLLDEEAWDTPRRLSDSDLFTHAGPGWRRGETSLDDPEDDR